MTSPNLVAGGRDRAHNDTASQLLDKLGRTGASMQLEQHLTLLRTVIDTSDDWIFVKDTQFRYALVNQSFAKALGRTPDSILGKTDPELGFSNADVFGNPAQGSRGFRADDIDVLTGQHIHNPYDVVTDDDGTQIIFDTHKKPLLGADGSIVGIVSTSKNVTERHQAEVQLAASRNLLQQVLDTFPQHVFWKDRTSTYLGCNRLFAKAAGFDRPEELIGKTDFDLPWSPEQTEHFRAYDKKVMAAKTPEVSIEEPMRQADGRHSWLETNKIPLQNEVGDVVGILGSFQDITERKQIELELRTSQQRLNLVIDQSPLAIIEWDTQGRIQQWNLAAEQTFGYTRDEALGQHLRLIVPPEYHDQVDQVFAALLAQAGGHRTINQNVTKGGSTIVCEWYNTPLVSEDGQVVGVASMAADVTEREHTKAKIAAQNQLNAFRAAVDAALVRTHTLQAALQSCTEAIVTHLDAAFARVWTLSADGTTLELQASAGLYTHIDGNHSRVPVGQFKIGLIAAEQTPCITNNMQEDPQISDRDWAQKEGLVGFAGYPIMLGNELLGVIVQFSRQKLNQTVLEYLENAAGELALGIKRYQTEAALLASEASLRQRTDELEQLMQDLQQTQLQVVQNEKMSALGNLVAGVAHEINNPVGFLKGNLKPAGEYVQDLFGLINLYQAVMPEPPENIEEEIEAIDLDFLREDLPKLLNSMNLGVDRIKNISTSLRTFSRADQDYKTSFNLHEGLDSTLLILKHRLKANEARPEIVVVRKYGKLPAIECFAGQLNQVFMNLLANAIDALEEDNQHHSLEDLKTEPNQILIETALSVDQDTVQIKIQDNGAGIPEALQDRIFEHLFTTKAVGKGTGLGLAIAHQIVVDNHGGSIAVTSSPGKGTAFILTLPVRATS